MPAKGVCSYPFGRFFHLLKEPNYSSKSSLLIPEPETALNPQIINTL